MFYLFRLKMESDVESPPEVKTISIPLTALNYVSFGILFVMIILGAIYCWTLCTRRRCLCRLCRGDYIVIDNLTSGG